MIVRWNTRSDRQRDIRRIHGNRLVQIHFKALKVKVEDANAAEQVDWIQSFEIYIHTIQY